MGKGREDAMGVGVERDFCGRAKSERDAGKKSEIKFNLFRSYVVNVLYMTNHIGLYRDTKRKKLP